MSRLTQPETRTRQGPEGRAYSRRDDRGENRLPRLQSRLCHARDRSGRKRERSPILGKALHAAPDDERVRAGSRFAPLRGRRNGRRPHPPGRAAWPFCGPPPGTAQRAPPKPNYSNKLVHMEEWWRRRESNPRKGCSRNPLTSNDIQSKSLFCKNFSESQVLSELITFAYVLVSKCSRFAPAKTCVFSTEQTCATYGGRAYN